MTDHHHHDEHEHEHEHDEHHHAHLDYPDAVRAFRAQKDEAFRLDPNSPIRAEDREAFDGLPYFQVDPSLRFEGLRLEPYSGGEPTSFQIPTTDGRLRPAERAGTLTFSAGGVACRLTAYVFADAHRHDGEGPVDLFVPFQDGTTGHESYGAGRYLDLEPEAHGTYSLDFNLAYHPYCVYDASYSCPLTPPENRLPVRIEAGERL